MDGCLFSQPIAACLPLSPSSLLGVLTMPDEPNDAPVGTPKMTIEGFNPFAGPAVNKQVVIDSNDLSPIGEAESLWLRALAFPPRPVDLVLQAVCWVSSVCF